MAQWSRRKFISKSIKGTAGLFTVSVLPLGLAACNDKKAIDTSSMANLGPLSELEKGPYPKQVNYSLKVKDAWTEQVREGFVYINKNKEDNSLLIMSPTCTHLGCTVGVADENLKKENVAFHCPCHNGRYNEYGINVGGPPPRPFDIFKSYIQEGNVYIAIFNPIKREKS